MFNRDSRTNPDPYDADATSLSLLGRAKKGEAASWRQLVDLYAPLLYEWCRRNRLQADDAADVVQNVFATVSKNFDRFRRDRPGDSFRGWLWTITRNKIRDHFRQRKGSPDAPGGTHAQMRMAEIPEAPPDLSTVTPAAVGGNSLEQRAIEMVRAGVEDRTWQAFWRVAVADEDAVAVAEDLGMSVAAVYNAKYRIRKRIRQELEELIE
ncbi:MAG: sigma-70 family RNA polymerase sigma factor [Pirellulales bacterium]|nr:sigma-70 family RNA polymerase sigma factor [Pirellulales bacterium]